MGIYSFTIQEVNRDLFDDKVKAITDAGLTVSPVGVQGDSTQHGIIAGSVQGHKIKLNYSWTNNNNVTVQILDKPLLASNGMVEHAIRGWFQPAPEVKPEPKITPKASVKPVVTPVAPPDKTPEDKS